MLIFTDVSTPQLVSPCEAYQDSWVTRRVSPWKANRRATRAGTAAGYSDLCAFHIDFAHVSEVQQTDFCGFVHWAAPEL